MKQDCANALSATLTSTSKWRLAIDLRYPDHRNVRASKLLDKLAGEASSLSDESWAALEPHFKSPRWGEALKQAARLVGFHRRRVSFAHFVRTLARLLAAPATAA